MNPTLRRLGRCENYRIWDFERMSEVKAQQRSMEARGIYKHNPLLDERGPWDDEPDKVQWIDPVTDLDCLIHRNHMGGLCGYAAVPPEHPFHGKDYGACLLDPECGETLCDHTPDTIIVVHGGLTFSGFCAEGEDADTICHIPAEGRPDDVYWFGFDCGHYMDFTPGMPYLGIGDEAVYRDLTYVAEQVTKLAAQLDLWAKTKPDWSVTK